MRPLHHESVVEHQPRRIAMVSTHGYVAANPPLGAADTGGQVVYVLELSKKLGELGYHVDIWTRRFEDQPEIEQVDERVRVLRAPCGGPTFIPKETLYRSLPEWVGNALRVITKHHLSYDLLISHYWDAGFAAVLLSRALGVPHVFTPHSLGLWKQRQMEKDRPGEAGQLEREFNFAERVNNEKLIITKADLVVATSPPQLDMLLADYDVPPSRHAMIPPGYDDRRFFPVSPATRESIRRRLGLSGKVILALGRLATNKGYDLLVRAFRVVAERQPEAVLHLALGGTTLDAQEERMLGELKALAVDLGVAERVRFGGFIPDADLADWYRAADEFVLSSRYEPFGMTAIEAMACGTPTIVTLHGGLYRTLTFGRHALFSDTFDADDLGITMLKPFQLPRLRTRLAKMGAYKARSLFSWSSIAQQLLARVDRPDASPPQPGDPEQEWDDLWNDGD